MKTWMKTTIAAALIASTTLGASAVMARGGQCDGYGPGGGPMAMHRMNPEQMSARIAQRAETHLARLELALAIKPDQQAAWTQFKGAMLVRAKDMGERMAAHRQGEWPKTAVERLQRMEEMSKFHQAELTETRRAVEALYPTLTDAQRKVFDTDFHMGPRGGKGERGMGPGKGGGMREGMGPGRG
jgi:hypothetical protein